jgi:hypothetical protein
VCDVEANYSLEKIRFQTEYTEFIHRDLYTLANPLTYGQPLPADSSVQCLQQLVFAQRVPVKASALAGLNLSQGLAAPDPPDDVHFGETLSALTTMQADPTDFLNTSLSDLIARGLFQTPAPETRGATPDFDVPLLPQILAELKALNAKFTVTLPKTADLDGNIQSYHPAMGLSDFLGRFLAVPYPHHWVRTPGILNPTFELLYASAASASMIASLVSTDVIQGGPDQKISGICVPRHTFAADSLGSASQPTYAGDATYPFYRSFVTYPSGPSAMSVTLANDPQGFVLDTTGPYTDPWIEKFGRLSTPGTLSRAAQYTTQGHTCETIVPLTPTPSTIETRPGPDPNNMPDLA